MKSNLAPAGALLWVVVATKSAFASPLLDLAGGTDGAGAMQAGTVEGGASAAYFNPALLVEAPSGLTIGILTLSEQIGISLDGRPGTQFAVPDGVANATHANGSALGNVPLPTGLLQNGQAATSLAPAIPAHPRGAAGTGHQTFVYQTLGFVARLFDGRLALGFHGIVPDGDFTNLNAFYSRRARAVLLEQPSPGALRGSHDIDLRRGGRRLPGHR